MHRRRTRHTPAAQGETTRRVLLTVAINCGDPLSYTKKGSLIVAPKVAAAVSRLQGASPTL